jgi:hypothetical protein
MTASLALPFPFLSAGLATRFLRAMLAAIVCVCLVGAGCAASDEFINLLTAIEPAASGIVGIVCLADPIACPIATAAFDGYKVAAAAVTQAYKDWQTADASQQPGKLGALQATVATLQTDFQNLLAAGHVKNQARQDAINAIAQAVGGEITNIVQIVEQTKAAGGTTQAAAMVLHEQYGGGPEPQSQATPNQAHHKKLKKRKLQTAMTAKQFKADLRAKLLVPTGDAQLDKVNAETAAKLK